MSNVASAVVERESGCTARSVPADEQVGLCVAVVSASTNIASSRPSPFTSPTTTGSAAKAVVPARVIVATLLICAASSPSMTMSLPAIT